MSKRSKAKQAQAAKLRKETEVNRRLRDETLTLCAETAKRNGDELAALHYETMKLQWSLIDDGYDYLTERFAHLSRDMRTRSIVSWLIVVAALFLLGPQVLRWLFG